MSHGAARAHTRASGAVILPASESFALHPRDGGEPYRIWVALPLSDERAPESPLSGHTPAAADAFRRLGSRRTIRTSPVFPTCGSRGGAVVAEHRFRIAKGAVPFFRLSR